MAEKLSRLVNLPQILCLLFVFVTGVVLGLATTSHINQFFGSKPGPLFFMTRSMAPPPEPDTNRAATASLFFTTRSMAPSPESDTNRTTSDMSCLVPDPRPGDCPNCLSMDTYLHPRNLTHAMSDAELFWRAAMVSRTGNYPFARVPKVAFMFLTRGPLPMLPLWEKFFNGQDRDLYSIYVHALPGFELNVSGDSPFHGRQIPSQNVQWGTVELFDAERRLLGNALLDFSNERFVLLSESCIPIYNFSTVYTYLTNSTRSFVESFDEPTRYGRGRYSRNMLPHIRLRQWRKGSQWFELNRDLATYIVSDTKYYTLFRKFCKPACYPDEHYLPTYLNMFHGLKNSNRSLTWVDWSTRASHPATYDKGNVTADLISSVRSNNGTTCWYNNGKTTTCHLFARKFAPSALGPLLQLSSTIMEF